MKIIAPYTKWVRSFSCTEGNEFIPIIAREYGIKTLVGAWPAIWMLGENYATNTWPAFGEIDIMEHKGNEPNVIHGTLHYPGVSPGGGNSATTTISNASSEFHIYSAIWSPTSVQIFVDGTLYHSVANNN